MVQAAELGCPEAFGWAGQLPIEYGKGRAAELSQGRTVVPEGWKV